MSVLQLYKNLPFDGGRRLPLFVSEASQNAYMEAHADLTLDVNYNRIGENFILSYPMDEICGYSYGRVKFGDKYFYFVIKDVFVNESSRTEISYEIDYWMTARYQYNITLGQGHVSRRYNLAGASGKQPFSPIKYSLNKKTTIGKSTGGWIIGSYANPDSKIAFFAFPLSNDGYQIYTGSVLHGTTPTFNEVFSSQFDDLMGIAPSSILGLWYSPIGPWDFTSPGSYLGAGWTITNKARSDDGGNCAWYDTYDFDTGYRVPTTNTVQRDCDIYTSEMYLGGICDRKGNILYLCPYGKAIGYLHTQLKIGASSCYVECRASSATTGVVDDKLEEVAFSSPCEPIDFLMDEYAQYWSGQRQVEIQQKKLQSDQALIGGLLGVGESGISGAVAGGLVGSTGVGAVAGIGIGAIGALAGWGLEQIYQPQFQSLTDLEYYYKPDNLSIVGQYISDLMDNRFWYSFVLEGDSYSRTRMATDINANGVYVDDTYTSCDSLLGDGRPLQCECEILGDIPSTWKTAISARFARGIKGVRLNDVLG